MQHQSKTVYCLYEALIEKYIYDRRVVFSGSRYYVIGSNGKKQILDNYLIGPDSIKGLVNLLRSEYDCDMFLYPKGENWICEFYQKGGIVLSIAESYLSAHAIVVAGIGLVKGMDVCKIIMDSIKRFGFNWDVKEELNVVDVDFKKKTILGIK